MDDHERVIEVEVSKRVEIIDGTLVDFDDLPKNLGMLPRKEHEKDDGLNIKLGDLEFDYTEVKKEVVEGKSKLRLVRGSGGEVLGFTVIEPNEVSSLIKMIWVNPIARGRNLGESLLRDAIDNSPKGDISMDIWGGEPMIKLASKMGFKYNPGGEMVNRYSIQK